MVLLRRKKPETIVIVENVSEQIEKIQYIKRELEFKPH